MKTKNGRPHHQSRRIVSILWVFTLAFAFLTSAQLPAANAATGNIMPPFDLGQSWCIYQGFNSSWSHNNNGVYPSAYGLDLVGSDCGTTSAAGRTVRAPRDGTASYSSAYGSMCINTNDGRSITMTHINSSIANGPVVAGQVVGTVATAGDKNNGGVAHIHFQIWSSPGCWSTGNGGMPFDTAHSARICGAPDLTATGPSSGNGTWSGTVFTGQDCSGSGSSSTVRTIPTSDGHIQTFKISNGALNENWYSPADGTTGMWTQPVAPPVQLAGSPAIVQRAGQYVVDAFVRGTNNQVYTTWYNFQTGGWGGWVGMGGGPLSFTSDPQVIATSDGHDQVFGTGGGYVEQNWYDPNAGTYGGWSTM